MPTVYLIDASPYIFRAFYAIPPKMHAPNGMLTNAIYGFTDFLIQILKEKPTHLAVAFDGSLTTSFRNEIYPAYKAQRALPPPDLEAQLKGCFEITEAMGICAFIDDKFEADDIIGTLLFKLKSEEIDAIVVSSDKDFAQLVDQHTTLWNFAQNKKYDVEAVKKKFGVRPDQIVDLLALMGDSVDNIPGLAGVGPKTASTLLQHFDSIEQLYQNIESVADLPIRGVKSLVAKLRAGSHDVFLSKRLASISIKAPASGGLKSLRYSGANKNALREVFVKYGFETILERIPDPPHEK